MIREFIREKLNFEKIGYVIQEHFRLASEAVEKFIKRNSPPGMELRQEKLIFIVGMICAVIYSLSFILKYDNELQALYYWEESDKEILMGVEKVLREGAVMPDFVYILSGSLVIFLLVGFLLMGQMIFRMSYFWQGSKSIYLMRRLPKRTELYRRVFLIPMIATIVCAVTALLVTMIYFGIYMLVTPKQCIAPGQWEILWGMIL